MFQRMVSLDYTEYSSVAKPDSHNVYPYLPHIAILAGSVPQGEDFMTVIDKAINALLLLMDLLGLQWDHS